MQYTGGGIIELCSDVLLFLSLFFFFFKLKTDKSELYDSKSRL